MSYHPQTGVHYAHLVLADQVVYGDVLATCRLGAERYPWISVHSPDIPPDHPIYQDPRVLLVCWHLNRPVPPPRAERQAHTALVYSEAIGPRDRMVADHRAEEDRAVEALKATRYDAVFGHAPGMVAHWKQYIQSFLLPLGYDPSIYGTPRFGDELWYDYVYYGSDVGKRQKWIPFFKERLGERFRDLSGSFGNELRAHMNHARASVYVAHSDVDTFSTWRTWQTLGTSAAFVAEHADSWPMVPGRHFVEFPRIGEDNAEETAVELLRLLREHDLSSVAKLAHQELGSEYSVDRCIHDYLVPAGANICGA